MPVKEIIDAVKTLISNVPYFLTWTGASDSTAALNFIYTGELGWEIIGFSISSGTATVTTNGNNNVSPGDKITIEGASLGTQSGFVMVGAYTVTASTSNTISFAVSLADTGKELYPEDAFVWPGIRPICCISEDSDPATPRSVGLGVTTYSGTVNVFLEANLSSGSQQDQNAATAEAREAWGNLLQGIMDTGDGTNDYILINSAEHVSGPEFTYLPSQDSNTKRYERWRAVIALKWGLE